MAESSASPETEILNALIQKGLILENSLGLSMYFRNTECPDSKGIKTALAHANRCAAEILNALIQKGLKLFQTSTVLSK